VRTQLVQCAAVLRCALHKGTTGTHCTPTRATVGATSIASKQGSNAGLAGARLATRQRRCSSTRAGAARTCPTGSRCRSARTSCARRPRSSPRPCSARPPACSAPPGSSPAAAGRPPAARRTPHRVHLKPHLTRRAHRLASTCRRAMPQSDLARPYCTRRCTGCTWGHALARPRTHPVRLLCDVRRVQDAAEHVGHGDERDDLRLRAQHLRQGLRAPRAQRAVPGGAA